MSGLLRSILRSYGLFRQRALARETADPGIPQREFLLSLIRRNEGTDYGGIHSFSSIRCERDFRDHVPTVEYADIRPHIERIMRGEENVLTKDPVLMFNTTSGTTSHPKFIPVTAKGQRRARDRMMDWFCHAFSDHPTLLEGSLLGIAGAAVEGRCETGIPFGSASGMIYSNIPSPLRRLFVLPSVVSEIADFEIRMLISARLAFEKPISFMATPNPLTLTRLAEIAVQHGQEIIRSLRNGWLTESCQDERGCLRAGVPGTLRSALKPNRSRAAFLEGILKKTGRLRPRDCWPDLALVGCWLGGSIGARAPSLSVHYGETPLRDIGYMATEGWVTTPMEDGTAAGILALHNNYYEFIPESQSDSTHPDILTAGELAQGGCYKILLTNENGLYRYDIGDIVRVEGFVRRTPVIAFLRKTGNILNICGEKLHLNHCLSAIAEIQALFSLSIGQFRVVPDDENLRHVFFLGIRSEVSEEFMRAKLLPALDSALCTNNIEYASRRRSKRINPPCIHVMDQSWEDDAQRHQGRDIQRKWVPFSAVTVESDLRHIKFSIR